MLDQRLALVDQAVDDQVDQSQPRHLRREEQCDQKRADGMYRDVGEKRRKPAVDALLAHRHPAGLQKKVSRQMLDDEQSYGPDQQLGGDFLRQDGHGYSFGLLLSEDRPLLKTL